MKRRRGKRSILKASRSHFPSEGWKMSWSEYHDRSMELASQAQVLMWQGDLEAAKPYYVMAAEAEVEALMAVEPDKLRTLGITVVSGVALWFKAQEFSKAKLLAYEWLASGRLPGFAIVQVEEILREILVSEAAAVAV
ncbi:MAG: hypothetical protein HC860_13140 [Alkalinema sp. RU_4_3]|nr:hypothetical protein [Alkalinema sp. RU_4_3]